MESVALKPQRGQVMALLIALGLLCLLCAVSAPLSLAAAFLLPLVGCPLIGRRQEWAFWIAAFVPAVVWLGAGYDPLLSASLALPSLLCDGGLWLLKKRKKLGTPTAIVVCMSGYALSFALLAALATRALGGALAQTLPQAIVSMVERSKQPGLTLYRLSGAGLVNLPDGFKTPNLLQLLLDATLNRQMLLSLRLTLEMQLFLRLPALVIQAVIILGLFTALRTQRLNCAVLVVGVNRENPAERKAHVALPPGFSLLALPPTLRNMLWVSGLLGFILITVGGDYPMTLGLLFYTAFTTGFQLLGAAVMVCMLMSKRPDRRVLYGILTAALYAFIPFALFLLGAADQAFHFRSTIISIQKDHQEEEKP